MCINHVIKVHILSTSRIRIWNGVMEEIRERIHFWKSTCKSGKRNNLSQKLLVLVDLWTFLIITDVNEISIASCDSPSRSQGVGTWVGVPGLGSWVHYRLATWQWLVSLRFLKFLLTNNRQDNINCFILLWRLNEFMKYLKHSQTYLRRAQNLLVFIRGFLKKKTGY